MAYDGTDFAGWQIQAGGQPTEPHAARKWRPASAGRPTVQGTLQRVLRQILQEPVSIIGSGRTDAGAHALGQVAHVITRSRITPSRLRHGLNSLLPPSITVRAVEDAPASFHARSSAISKRYRYTIVRDVPLPFERRYVHHVRVPLDVRLMQREAKALLGRHDFRAFQRTGGAVEDTRRRITKAVLRRSADRLVFEIEGTGFLYTMVRSIVGTLIDVGRGRLPAGAISAALRRRDRRLVGPTAPANGLCLVEVAYRNR